MLRSEPMQQHFTEDLIAELPEPAQRYFLHAIAPGTPLATSSTQDARAVSISSRETVDANAGAPILF